MTDAPPTTSGERGVLALLALATSAAVVGTRWGVFTPDTRPDAYLAPGRLLASAGQAWVAGASGLGQGNFNAGAAPVAAVLWLMRAVGVPAWFAVRLWRLLLLLVAAVGIRRYLAVLLGARLTPTGRTVATVFWVANPYVVVAGSTTPILLPYAVLPWMLLALVQSTRHPGSWRWPARFALLWFAQAGLNAGVVSFFALLAVPAHLLWAWWGERRPVAAIGSALGRCGLLSLAVSIYWLAPSLLAAGTGTGIAEATEDPVDVARTSSAAESARLLGQWPLYGRSGSRLFLGGYASFVDNPTVLVCSFLVVVAVGATLVWARARERLLVVGLLALGLPVMIGLFPVDRPSPAGRALASLFEAVPASLAFRTTNKVGAVVVLAYALALALGARAVLSRQRSARARTVGIVLTALVLVGASWPMWSGDLYPLGYRVPASWRHALADLDRSPDDGRVLVVPGGTGGNYRWGMRSPDDLFASLLDRPVAVRSTVVGRGDPAGNLLSGFDTQLAQGALPPTATSDLARRLGAGQVLVRNDLLTEEIGGPPPSRVHDQVAADPGLRPSASFGRLGTDTIPGGSGAADRPGGPGSGGADARRPPIEIFDVARAQGSVHLAPAAGPLLVDGDGEAFPALSWAGLLDADHTVRYLGDLDGAALDRALADGGRIVLTDTNRRRAWDSNRVTNATSPTLAASGDIDAGNGATVTLWPDDPDRQTVTEVIGDATVSADAPAFGLHPFGRAAQALDGDPTTAWQTGGLETAAGDTLRIRFARPRTVHTIAVTAQPTEPSRATRVRVRAGDRSAVVSLPAGSDRRVVVPLPPARIRSVSVTVLDQSAGANPVGLAVVDVDGLVVRTVTRLPRTLHGLTSAGDTGRRAAVAAAPLDILLTRARGVVEDLGDDEESQLDRRFDLPGPRPFRFTAELDTAGTDTAVVAALRAGDPAARTCRPVATLDGADLSARVVSDADDLESGRIRLEGCGAVELSSGRHELLGRFGWRLDRVRLASAGRASSTQRVGASGRRSASDGQRVRVRSQQPTRVELEVGRADGSRILRLGQAFDPRWRLRSDGRDLGPPVLVDGYSAGWRIDGRAQHLVVDFGPQRVVRATAVLSAMALVGVAGLAFAPPPRRWRARPRSGAAAGAGPAT